jgi:hypothetical protein
MALIYSLVRTRQLLSLTFINLEAKIASKQNTGIKGVLCHPSRCFSLNRRIPAECLVFGDRKQPGFAYCGAEMEENQVLLSVSSLV